MAGAYGEGRGETERLLGVDTHRVGMVLFGLCGSARRRTPVLGRRRPAHQRDLDAPNWVVSAFVANNLFVSDSWRGKR